MPPSAKSTLDALNGPIIAAASKLAMLACPLIISGALWAADSWVASRVKAAPEIHRLVISDADHHERIRTLEEAHRATVASNSEIIRRLDRLSVQSEATRDALNRLLGKLEAK